MALIENANFGLGSSGPIVSALRGFSRRREERRLQTALAGKPDRLIRDMGLDPAAIQVDSWNYELGEPQAIGNRP